MSSRTLAQDDFSLLELAAGQDANTSQQHGFTSIVRAASGDSMKSVSSCDADVETFRPVNFIPDEAHELIQNWELSLIRHKEVASTVDSEEIEPIITMQSLYEPMRFMESPPPPKRFHRTFWRSLTRRIYQLEKMN